MRPVRKITAEEENFRVEPFDEYGDLGSVIRRDYVEPEPIGTIVLMAFRIVGYDRDCDGSAMARLEHIDKDGEPTGWDSTNIGLYPESDLVVTLERWRNFF